MSKIYAREALAETVAQKREQGQKVVFTNGCFDILHVGHVELLERARALGDFLVVGLNSDTSVQRLKGPSRPIHPQDARAKVLGALESVGAVMVFEEDTPIETIRVLRPNIHVKGGDYRPDDLPEAATVREVGGEVVIVPLVEGFSSTKALQKSSTPKASPVPPGAVVMVPARYGSTRFPGKPLVELGGATVIARVVRAVLESKATLPVVVATDDERIASEVTANFDPREAIAVMTSAVCHTGTDRLAEATRARLGEIAARQIIVNVQGDEPFIDPAHIDALIDLMMADETLPMATLATPILDPAQATDPNVVKAIVGQNGRALYFSRATVPYDRDHAGAKRYRHLGIYAYDARWLLKMAALPPSPLEEIEKLEQLRALENGAAIGVAIVENVVPIAIDTPEDLKRAEEYLRSLM